MITKDNFDDVLAALSFEKYKKTRYWEYGGDAKNRLTTDFAKEELKEPLHK